MTALRVLFEQFLKEKQYLRNVTPKTLDWYASAWVSFTKSVSVSEPRDLTRRTLSEFVVRSRERGLSPVTVNTWSKALNAFLGWLHAEGPLKTEKRVLRLLSTEELKRLLAFKPKASPSPKGYDAVTGLYTYLWKTQRSWAQTCRQPALAFQDGPHRRPSPAPWPCAFALRRTSSGDDSSVALRGTKGLTVGHCCANHLPHHFRLPRYTSPAISSAPPFDSVLEHLPCQRVRLAGVSELQVMEPLAQHVGRGRAFRAGAAREQLQRLKITCSLFNQRR